MALASSRQPPAIQQLTPPSSSHGGRGSWDFAVPPNNAKPSVADQKPFMYEDEPAARPYSPRQPLSSVPNGFSKPLRANNLDSQWHFYDEEQGHPVSNQVNEPQSNGNDFVANGGDLDNTWEYHKEAESRTRNKNVTQAKKKVNNNAKPKRLDMEKDNSNWIHRDKLKEIESRELIEAGFKVGRTSRSGSRSQSATRSNRDRTNSEATDATHSGDDRYDQRRMISPIPAEEEETYNESTQWDLRTPEEIEAEQHPWNSRNNHVIRPSTSRIPIAKISPAPVTHTFVERDALLPRSRAGSGNWGADATAVNGARVRSASVSSQALLDDSEATERRLRTPPHGSVSIPTSPVTGSPPKAKVPGKPTPTSGVRKTSVQHKSTAQKSRNTSATSPVKRPGTSGGSVSRPTTSHRPEGEAPWIATMYKPDPRLPPDQQIIPTHAKRMQQEQWENEGKAGSMYDREFRPLNTDEFKDRRNSQFQPLEMDRQEDDLQWPLPSPTKATADQRDTNVKSPTSEQGGYKLTPTIPQNSRAPSRTDISKPVPATSPRPSNSTRLPEPPAVEEKEKKSCCCIVM